MATLLESQSLLALRPDLAKEWHPTRNGRLGPKDVAPDSIKKVWWLCAHGHWWLASVRCRARGMRCSFCMSVEKQGYQRMVDVNPGLLKEWHPSRNPGLKPGEVYVNQKERMWWICAQGHEWQSSIRSRLKGKSCPVCSSPAPRVAPPVGHRTRGSAATAGGPRTVSNPTGFAGFSDAQVVAHSGAELRKSRRYARFETVMVERRGYEAFAYAHLINFSAEGMSLQSDFGIPPGETFRVQFEKPLHTSLRETVMCKVVWCREPEDHEEGFSLFSMGVLLI
jgi:hypothetical protein